MRRAVFLDRDGTINRNVWNPATGAYESPLTPEKLELLPGVIPALQKLCEAEYLLILISNQPNAAKGKTTTQELEAIHQRLEESLQANGIPLAASYYCLHHPDFTGKCQCRKPLPYFLFKARDTFEIDLEKSWMIGDRVTDVECGRAAGTNTILLSEKLIPETKADYISADLLSAVRIILGFQAVNASTRLCTSI